MEKNNDSVHIINCNIQCLDKSSNPRPEEQIWSPLHTPKRKKIKLIMHKGLIKEKKNPEKCNKMACKNVRVDIRVSNYSGR